MLWAQELIAPNEVRAWEEAGLQTQLLPYIIELRRSGVPPEAMGWKVHGETMLEKIRTHHYSPQLVIRTLRTAGLLGRKSA
jgi:hypothetical protein